MEFLEEWKSYFPIGSVLNPPKLISSSASLGPLFFNPIPNSLTQLLKSPSLVPRLLSPHPRLSLSTFISTSSPDCPIPPSTASSIASRFGALQNDDDEHLLHNRLQLLHCPHTNTAIGFFSTGYNHDQIGYFWLSSNLGVKCNVNGPVFTAKNQLNSRIIRILVNPVDDDFVEFSASSSLVTIGLLMAITMYSVHWFAVKIDTSSDKPHVLSYLGFKLFKSCSVAGACWSPHLPAEAVVLLESGALFLFDLETSKSNSKCFKGTRMGVKWDDDSSNSWQNCKWLGCELSWHPRILIVARSDAVYLVDLRCDECNVTCLAKIEMLRLYCSIEKERFLALSRAGSDGFQFVVASDSLLVLCDVRNPMLPMLQWAHYLDKPCYIDVFRMSDLRSHSRDEMYKGVTELGFGIIVGSFWNCEFSLFCYGPSLPARRGSVASKIVKPLYAWGLPSALSLSGCECHCGSCLIRGEFSKDALPEWVDWQQKKDIVLGFGILNNDLSALVSEPDEFGGFTLVRLMSSGKLEAQRYCASWDLVKKSEVGHKESSVDFEDSLLYRAGDEDYKFPKRFKYLKLDYLYGYLNGNLAEVLDSKLKKPRRGHGEKESFCHEVLCKKLNVCGFGTAPLISVVFNDINMPTSIHEVALRRLWAGLPMELLQLAFSSYAKFPQVILDQHVSLEFSVVPDLPQLPPFFLRNPSCHSNKSSDRVQRSDALVGPVLPLPILLTLHEFRKGCPNSQEVGGFSAEVELSLRCNEVMQVAKEMVVSDSGSKLRGDPVVSLEDNSEEMWVDSQKPKPFFLYHPTAFESSALDHTQGNYVDEDEKFSTLISKVHEKEHVVNDKVYAVGLEMFDDLCPLKLKFDTRVVDSESLELKELNILKNQFARWQQGFDPYQGFCTRSKLKKKDA